MELLKHLRDHNPCLSLSTTSKFQRRTIQAMALVSVFYGMLLFLSSSLPVPLCFRSFRSFSFSAYFTELQSLGYSTSKNYMFLLCNGILVIIVGSSGLIGTGRSDVAFSGLQTAHNDPRLSGHGRGISNGPTERRRSMDAEEKPPVADKGEFLIQKDVIQEQGSELAITEASQYDDGEIEDELSRDDGLISDQAIREHPSELRMITYGAVIDGDGNGDDDETHGELSIEELNRKCDEFIMKMRGELCCRNLAAP